LQEATGIRRRRVYPVAKKANDEHTLHKITYSEHILALTMALLATTMHTLLNGVVTMPRAPLSIRRPRARLAKHQLAFEQRPATCDDQ